MKTKEELNDLKKEIEAINKKLSELTEEEMKEVVGGSDPLQDNGAENGNSGTFTIPEGGQPGPYAPHFYGKDPKIKK